jgi:hypothetical protein
MFLKLTVKVILQVTMTNRLTNNKQNYEEKTTFPRLQTIWNKEAIFSYETNDHFVILFGDGNSQPILFPGKQV